MFDRIDSNPQVFGGKPCVRGTRLSVEFIMEVVAPGGTREQIVQQFPQLSLEDVEQAIRFAAERGFDGDY